MLRSGSPATGPQTRKSNSGTPSFVRSRPNTSQMVPNSNGVTGGSTSTATEASMGASLVGRMFSAMGTSATRGEMLFLAYFLP